MITVSRLTVKELAIFVNDTSLADRNILPISRQRAMSFMANPRTVSSDVVMYLAYSFDELVGYRTVLPDIAYVEGVPLKVAWLSGSWVHPNYRRKGIASELLNAIYADWGQRVLSSNFAPYAKKVYDKTHNFTTISESSGARFYLKSTFLKSYNCCSHDNIFKLGLEKIINLFNPTQIFRKFLKLPKDVELEYFTRPDDELSTLFEESTNSTLTGRSRIEWNWILRFPWMQPAPLGDRVAPKYFFASAPPSFNQYIIKVFKNKELIGMLHIQHSHTRLTVPYSYFEPESAKIMAQIVLLHARNLNATFIALYNPLLINELYLYRRFFLWITKRKREYLSTNELAERLKNSVIRFNDGDGDCAFI